MDGTTSQYLLHHCDLEKLILVDTTFSKLNNTINTANYKNLELIEKDSLEASRMVGDKTLDLVFIDADHYYESVLKDIIFWLQKIKPGGCICGHDYGEGFDCRGVRRAVNEIFPKANLIKDSIDDVIHVWYVYI